MKIAVHVLVRIWQIGLLLLVVIEPVTWHRVRLISVGMVLSSPVPRVNRGGYIELVVVQLLECGLVGQVLVVVRLVDGDVVLVVSFEDVRDPP